MASVRARSASDEQSAVLEKQMQNACERCDRPGGQLRLSLPLIAVARLSIAALAFFTILRVHARADVAWYPLPHRFLFALLWLLLAWNLLHASGSIFGYAYFPSPRRTCGLPPIVLNVAGRSVLSLGGPDEDDAERRRRWKRIQCSMFDLLLTLPTVVLLVYSVIAIAYWESLFVGLRRKTIAMIAGLCVSELSVAVFQLFHFVEAKILSIRISLQDNYEREPHSRVMIP